MNKFSIKAIMLSFLVSIPGASLFGWSAKGYCNNLWKKTSDMTSRAIDYVSNRKEIENLNKKLAEMVAKDLELKFLQAVKNNDLEQAQLFIKQGVNINAMDEKGCSALLHAIRNKNIQLVEFLIIGGSDINQDGGYHLCGMTPLIAAILYDMPEAIGLLVKKGARVDAADATGYISTTALMYAASQRDVKTVELLLQFGADVNYADIHGRNALIEAIRSGNKQVVELLINAGANVDLDKKNGFAQTLRGIAKQVGNKDIVLLLAASGRGMHDK